jgi:acetyl esterase/lipase
VTHKDAEDAADTVLTRPAEPPDVVLRYADHDDGVVDLYLPPKEARPDHGLPLVVFVHGGFWRQGYDRTHGRPLADDLATKGFAVALPEYRRVGGAGGWPTTAHDVEAALLALAGLLDGTGVTTSPTTLVGHSAGGHLVLWLANQPVASTVRRVVALAPVGNLRRAAEHATGSGAVLDLLGGTPDQRPEVYDAADPASRMRTRPPCEVVVLHGDRDGSVPVESSRGLRDRFDWLDYRELAGVDHFALVDPLSDAWPVVLDAIR